MTDLDMKKLARELKALSVLIDKELEQKRIQRETIGRALAIIMPAWEDEKGVDDAE